ncbi:MAG: hypothetical protein ABSD98_08380 [Candidatus Korobacteraceae bacterium]
MTIKAEDFPVYQLLLQLNHPGVELAKKDFAAAQNGGDEAAYTFALGIQTIAAIPGIETKIPGLTAGMVGKTLESCLAIFEDVASRGHTNANFMVGDFKARGLGRKRPPGAPGPS